MLRIFTGDVRTDISHMAVQEMTERATSCKNEKFIIIVPEQFTLQTQKRVAFLHPSHACMNIDVVSFERLSHVVLAKLGMDITEVLDDVGMTLILRTILNDISDDLTVYRSKTHQSGFIEELKSLITEFRQYRVDDNMLFLMQESAEGTFLARKLADIRLIFRRFNEAIIEKYSTADDVLDVFEKNLTKSDFMTGSHVYLDGFTGFTPIQYRIIRKMLHIAADVSCTVVVPGQELKPDPKEFDLFALPDQTFCRLQSIAEEEGSSFEHICTDQDHSSASEQEAHLCIQCLENPEGEVRFAAGQILKLVREGKARFRDIAVLTSDMEGFYPYFKNVFSEAGIVTFIDHKEEFSGNLLIRLVQSALEVSVKGMMYEPVFDYLKTGFTGITPDECSLLENYALEFNIRGRAKWESTFTANREVRSGEYYWDLDQINDIRARAITELCKFYGRTSSGEHKTSLYCTYLKKLFEALHAKEKISHMAEVFAARGDLPLSKQYEQIYDQIILLIEKISRLMEDTPVSAREFRELLESGAGEIKVGIIPPSLDAMTCGDLTRTRIGGVRYLFFLGLNEGKIPSASGGSVLFTQKERTFLRKDYEIAPSVQENIYIQRYYLYLAFNRPEECLYLTYSAASASGEQTGPSSVLEDLDELIPGRKLDIQKADKGSIWKSEAERLMADRLRELAHSGRFVSDQVMDFFAENDPALLRKMVSGALFSNVQTPLDERVALDLYGDVLKGSVSRYESFYSCPYRHFLNYGMHLEKRREYKVEAADLGTIYHDALDRYARQLNEEGLSFRNVNDEDSHRIIASCVKDAVDAIGSDVLSSSARNEYLTGRIMQISERTTDILRDHVRCGLFEPDSSEFVFDEAISEDVRFRGKIDRIDIYDGGDIFVKIIDYKSGNKKFSIKDIYTGVQLQLAAYMNSAVNAVKERHPDRNVRPGGIYYYLISDKYVREQDDNDTRNRMSGVTLYDDRVIHAVDTTLGQDGKTKSSIVQVALAKNGLDSRSLIANAHEFDSLISFAEMRIVEAGDQIRAGRIDIAPIKGDQKSNGCSFCDYKDICRFDAGSFGTDWREVDMEKSEMEDVIYGRD